MSEPQISYILATDRYATARPVIERLLKQTIPEKLELVLIAPTRESVEDVFAHEGRFARVQLVIDPVSDLAQARAKGIRTAAAPLVFVGETHSYPQPEMLERLVARFAQGIDCAVPSVSNANPRTARSWAGLISDYGRWHASQPEGRTERFPIYNAAFRRAALVEFGERLEPALSHGDELQLRFEEAGHQAVFEPSARLDHVNVVPLKDWVRERFVSGVLIAHSRALRWPLAKRLFYALCSPAIPLVLILRVAPGIVGTFRSGDPPWASLPLIAFGFLLKGAGEFAGYLGMDARQAAREMHEYEVHKLAYAGRGKS